MPAAAVARLRHELSAQCHVTSGIPSFAMQCLLGALMGILLILKWKTNRRMPGRRTPVQRSGAVFFYDILKQVLAALWLHVLNVSSTDEIHRQVPGADECSEYLLTIVLDTTIGTGLLWFLVSLTKMLLERIEEPETADFGNYKGQGTELKGRIVAKQTVVWIFLVTVMKFLMVVAINRWGKAVLVCITGLLRCTERMPNLKLFITMVLLPAFFNAFQFLCLDEIIRAHQVSGENDVNNKLPMLAVLDEERAETPNNSEGGPLSGSIGASFPLLRRSSSTLATGADYKKFEFFKRFCHDRAANKYGLGGLDDKELMTYHEWFKEQLVGDESLEGVKRVLSTQRKLVVFFNDHIDASQVGEINRSHFIKAFCGKKDVRNFFGQRQLGHGAQARKKHRKQALKLYEELCRRTQASFVHFREVVLWAVGKYPHERELYGSLGEVQPGTVPGDVQIGEGEEQSQGVGHEASVSSIGDTSPHPAPWALPTWLDDCTPTASSDPSLPRHWLPKAAYNEDVLAVFKEVKKEGRCPALCDCVGPAVIQAWYAIMLNFLAVAFMPLVAFATMGCKDSDDDYGFADHNAVVLLLFDAAILVIIAWVAITIERNILKYMIISQLDATDGVCKLEILCWTIDFRKYDYNVWLNVMSVLTALNTLNTWTNAEVFGRVFTTANSCSEGRGIFNLWTRVLDGSFLEEVVTATVGRNGANFEDMACLLYALIFSQHIFAVLYAFTSSQEVNYGVGHAEEDCHSGYPTAFERKTGADHGSVVRVLSAINTFEAIGFMDMAYGKWEMQQQLEAAELEAQRLGLHENSSEVGKHVNGYLKAVQVQLHRSAIVRLFFVGLLQNAVQTKLQISILSLGTYQTKGHNSIDYMFFVGVFTNLFGYFLSILDLFDLWTLGREHFWVHGGRIEKLLRGRLLTYELFDEIWYRTARIRITFCAGALFTTVYIAFFLYLVVSFAMFFRCTSGIWNIPSPLWDVDGGCWSEDSP